MLMHQQRQLGFQLLRNFDLAYSGFVVWQAPNGWANLQPVLPGLFTPVLGLFIPVVGAANLTDCQVERGLGALIVSDAFNNGFQAIARKILNGPINILRILKAAVSTG